MNKELFQIMQEIKTQNKIIQLKIKFIKKMKAKQ